MSREGSRRSRGPAGVRRSPALAACVLVILLAAVSSMSCSRVTGVDGSGNITSETRDVSDFDRVVVQLSGEMEITQGDVESLTIEADDNLLEYIRTDVENGTLTIDRSGTRRIDPSRPIIYKLSLRNLSEFEIDGSLVARSSSLKTDSLTIDISGSGDVTVASLLAQELSVRSDGSGKLDLGGQVATQRIEIDGSARYEAGGLASASTTISIDGSGKAVLQASDTLDVSISGSGEVQYYGDARVTQSISGSGSIQSLGEPPM